MIAKSLDLHVNYMSGKQQKEEFMEVWRGIWFACSPDLTFRYFVGQSAREAALCDAWEVSR
jgi:hypothetical protein